MNTKDPDPMEIYDPGSHAVKLMAAAFDKVDRSILNGLTDTQMRTIAFALRGMHPKPDWVAGFVACAYLMSGRYDEYAEERDEFLAARKIR